MKNNINDFKNTLPSLTSRNSLFEVDDGLEKSEFLIKHFELNGNEIILEKFLISGQQPYKLNEIINLKVTIYDINGNVMSIFNFLVKYVRIERMYLDWEAENVVIIAHKFEVVE